MLALPSFVLLAILPSFLTSAAPKLSKRTASLTGDSTTGDVSTEPYDTYGSLPDGTGAGICGYPYSSLTNLNYVVAVDGAAGPLDLATQCGRCVEVVASLAGAAPKTIFATVIDQRNYGKPGLDLSTPAFTELFGMNTGRFCKTGCQQGSWDINWKPAADPSLCTAQWKGQCPTGHPNMGKYCG